MRLKIEHTTTYRYDAPIRFGLQELRMTPKSRAGQTVLRWNVRVSGGVVEARFDDQHNNQVILIGIQENVDAISIHCEGEVETTDAAGVVGTHGGFAPLWYFERSTPLTKPGDALRALAASVGGIGDHATDIARLHALSDKLGESVAYEVGASDALDTAEAALVAGKGVCQDHAHIFCAAARAMGIPARYVSGHLFRRDGAEQQEASHAWAEACLPSIGWVGFDPANGISPDDAYVRVAIGLDYRDAAPIAGRRVGGGEESLSVDVRVTQAQSQSQN